jgi:hypothetical protein
LDCVIVAGVCLAQPVGRSELMLDIRYAVGMITVDNTRDKLDVRNRGLAVSFGYGIRSGK